MEDVITKLKDAVTSGLASEPQARRDVIKAIDKANVNEESRHYLEFLKDKNDMSQIYILVKNKKLSNNQIRKKIKEFLKDPEDLKNFLNAILDTKSNVEKLVTKTGKKEENTEAMGAASAGGYSMPLFSTTKGDIVKGVKTVREQLETDGEKGLTDGETAKTETKEATGASSSGQYSQPAIWAKSMSKKNWKGASTKYMPGAKRVQVKKKCTKFPYCNQGDIKALKIFENESVQNAIDSVSSKYGINKEYISEIVFQEIRKRQK
jgi:hypothetical protein